jgi:hypothetical protein
VTPVLEKFVDIFQLSGVEKVISFLDQAYFELSER